MKFGISANIIRSQFAGVAQLDRVSVYETEGQGFDSLRPRQRLNLDWYEQRWTQNAHIKRKLVGHISERIGSEYRDQLWCLNYEDLWELAVGVSAPQVAITLGSGSDFSNGYDAKFAIARTHSYGKSYSALINCRNKQQIIAGVYERLQQQFYWFVFRDFDVKEISIPFDVDSGEPKFDNRNWQHCYPTIESAVGAMLNS